MNLYIAVYQLLKENDCVIIPNFGGFVANYFEAKIDFPTQEFYPPHKKIAFNQDLRNNDGLLINHISNTSNTDWSNAEETVKRFVEDLYQQLKDSKTIDFGELGKFALNNGTLVFTPNKNLNLDDSSFGLKGFNFPMIGTARGAIQIQKTKELSKTKSAKTNKKKRTIKPVVFFTTAAAVIAGLLFVAVQFEWIRIENNPVQQTANIAPVELVDSSNTDVSETTDNNVNVEDAVEVEVLDETVTTDEVEEVPIVEPEDVTVEEEIVETVVEVAPVTQDLPIHVIGGSFGDRSNAVSYQNELIAMGYNSQILPTSNGMFRVSVKSFAENADAVSELNSLRNATGNASLWVLNW